MDRYVALTFDVDAYSVWIGSYKTTNAAAVSRGEFDLIATDRILRMLAEHGIPATFFVPGHTALAFPELVRRIRDEGHEIGHHGFVHERITELNADEERHVMDRGLEALEEVAGIRPIGYRSPSCDFTERTPSLLVEKGFKYDSSLSATDFEPYWIRDGDRFTSAGPYVFGQPVPLVEVPFAWHLDDFPHFEYVRGGPFGLRAPDSVLATWADEFRFFAERVDSGCYTLTLHPQVIGRGYRFMVLERLVQVIKQYPDIRFARLGDVATSWADGREPLLVKDTM